MHLLLSIDWKILYAKDLFLSPLYLALIYLWAYYRKSATYKGTDIEKYFIPALTVRMVGAVLTAFMYQYYYGYGDCFTYWLCSKYCWEHLFSSPDAYLNILIKPFDSYSYNTLMMLDDLDHYKFFRDPSTNIVIRSSMFFSLFTFNTFLPVSFFITLFAFLGNWRFFLVFSSIYPKNKKYIAIAILFIPSVFFWGTGVMKDPICLGAMGFVIYYVHKLFILKKISITSVVMIIFFTIIISMIKTYIVMSFIPACIFWVCYYNWFLIKSKFLKAIAIPFFLFSSIFGGILFINNIGELGQKYSTEAFLKTAQTTQEWLTIATKQVDGSSYSLGEIDYSYFGLLKVAPKAINVTLFRPYIWEARKPILIPAAIESLVFLSFILYFVFKLGIIKFIRVIFSSPHISFCFIFSMIFGFAVGFTSYNFGALSRYKLPCMPFFGLFIAIIYFQHIIPLKNKKDKNGIQREKRK